MRRMVLVALAILVGGAGAIAWQPDTRPSWLDRLAQAIGIARRAPAGFSGYVEAEYVMVTSPLGGTLTRLSVTRGDQVAADAPLFTLDGVAESAAVAEAEGKLRQAEAQLADLLTGKRSDEIQAIVAQRTQAAAALRNSEIELQRQAQLRTTGNTTVKSYDDMRAQRDRDRARVDELEAQLRVARLPGREQEIRAAEHSVDAARGTLGQAEWRLAQKRGTAPAAGLVVDTLFRPGEMVPAGAPVVQLLPPPNLKIRFFVPETAVAHIAPGDRVQVTCDGCPAPVAATVRFVAPQAEYTPPVIYSREQRARLVFMVEARPVDPPAGLKVGQPVDVTVTPPPTS